MKLIDESEEIHLGDSETKGWIKVEWTGRIE